MTGFRWGRLLAQDRWLLAAGLGAVVLLALAIVPATRMAVLPASLVVAILSCALLVRALAVEQRRAAESQEETSRLRECTQEQAQRLEAAERVAREAAGAVGAAGEGIARLDSQGAHIWTNDSYGDLLGYSPDELMGVSWRRLVDSSAHKQAGEAYRQLQEQGGAVIELSLLTKAGEPVPARLKLVRDSAGNGRGAFYAFLQDLSEWREIEAALDLKNVELNRANQELEQFAYFAAHDLQEPTRQILTWGSLLEKDLGGDLPEAAATDLHFMTDAAKRMRRLVEDLLLLSRAGRSAMRREELDLDGCVDEALTALEMMIEDKHANIVRDSLPEVYGDRRLVTQLFQNLISNALKFCDRDRPEVRITAERNAEEWVLGVKDNGIGIEPEYAERIFEPFKRLHGPDQFEGTGIGLAICKKAVERHDGRIWVESKLGEGAHFKLVLGGE